MKSSHNPSALQDEITFDVVNNTSTKSGRCVLVCFITGNPGLIEFYRPFFQRLQSQLRKSTSHSRYILYGRSLPGFGIGDQRADDLVRDLPFSLDQQLEHVRQDLCEQVLAFHRNEQGESSSLEIVLIGHSVGAYITLETMDWWQSMSSPQNNCSEPAFKDDRQSALQDVLPRTSIVAGICLFPTVVDIALSPNGRKMTPLTRLPYFALLAHILSKLIFALIPLSALISIIQLVNGMPQAAARVTASFLKSNVGVYQAMYMTKNEMDQITKDKWSDDFWGSSSSDNITEILADKAAGVVRSSSAQQARHPKLFFYWGENDHWVANKTRDTIIATRSHTADVQGDARPHMEIDSRGIPHGFCLEHSEPVADKVAEYILSLERS